MPGVITPTSVASVGAVAGMKRPHVAESVPTYGEPHPKKRKVVHKLHHTQPVHHIVEPLGGGFGAIADPGFFDHQLRRTIAITCKSVGFESAKPEALEQFRSLVDGYVTNFLAQVRKSMSSARRTETLPYDWIYALTGAGISGSSSLEQHFDTGDIPPSLLQPPFAPPEPPEQPPPDLEGLLGPELSGRADKESKKYIPKHFPPFPSKHTYKSTPVYAKRENDPRKIREKAAEEGIDAEKSLRMLMAAQKMGLQKLKGGKRKMSERMKKRDEKWKKAMEDSLKEEAEREENERHRRAALRREEEFGDDEFEEPEESPEMKPERKVNLEDGVHVNYDRKFWRKSARGV